MAGTKDTDHEPIGNDVESTVTDKSHRPPVTRVAEFPPTSSPTGESLGSDAFVDRYQRREILGRGGMGEVTSWRDERLGREVAV